MEQPQLGICELQYLRSLVMCDNLENDYNQNRKAYVKEILERIIEV